MRKILEFRNNNFSYNNEKGFKDLYLDIYEGDIISLIGPSGSGKTTILKMICHMLPNDNLYYDGININKCDISDIRRNVVVVLDTDLRKNNIQDELKQFLSVCGMTDSEQRAKSEKMIEMFDLHKYIDVKTKDLPNDIKNLIKILRFLIIDPAFIAIDGLFGGIQEENKIKIIEYLKESKITLLNVVSNLNDTLYGNKIFVLDNFALVLEGSTKSILKTDTMLKKLGYDLPDEVELSIELMNYGVLNKIYIDKEKLVNTLWK